MNIETIREMVAREGGCSVNGAAILELAARVEKLEATSIIMGPTESVRFGPGDVVGTAKALGPTSGGGTPIVESGDEVEYVGPAPWGWKTGIVDQSFGYSVNGKPAVSVRCGIGSACDAGWAHIEDVRLLRRRSEVERDEWKAKAEKAEAELAALRAAKGTRKVSVRKITADDAAEASKVYYGDPGIPCGHPGRAIAMNRLGFVRRVQREGGK